MKTVFISGNFNILHPGHIRLFKFAKKILNTIGKFDIGTVKIGQDAYGIADLQVDMELVLKGTNEIITESFQYYFDNGEFLDGAVDLTKGNQRLVIYAPGDMDGTLDNYQGYELG